MGRSHFLSILLLSLFIALSFSNGFGRKITVVVEPVNSSNPASTLQLKESGRKLEMETMDYSDPEPNTNTQGGYASPPPPSPNHG